MLLLLSQQSFFSFSFLVSFFFYEVDDIFIKLCECLMERTSKQCGGYSRNGIDVAAAIISLGSGVSISVDKLLTDENMEKKNRSSHHAVSE